MNKYTILIPIHNEKDAIPRLLSSLKQYARNNHEILIIDDGSKDGTAKLLKECTFISLISLKINKGKGIALRKGLLSAKYSKVIIFDGDLELDSSEISKLMILDKEKNIYSSMGYRYKNLNPFKSSFYWCNFIFTSFFNILYKSNHRDILCCAKSFYVDEKIINILCSKGFDIDVELSSILTIRNKCKKITQIPLKYNRRTKSEGKKLQVSDGWIILSRMIKMIQNL